VSKILSQPLTQKLEFPKARSGAPKGKRNGAYKHGLHTKEAVEERREVRKLLRQARETIAAIS
jgi:hypothetical protein